MTTQTARADEMAGRSTPPDKMTYEAFLAWADGRHAEWVDGEVQLLVSPATQRHQQIAKFLIRILSEFVESYDLGVVLFAPFQMKLASVRRGREPDVLFIGREHLDRLTAAYLDGPADLAIEIVSPESRDRDRITKRQEYAQGGVPEYWLIDPERQEALFYQLNANGSYDVIAPDEDGIYHSAVLSGLWLHVDWLWQEPSPLLREIRTAWKLI